MAASQIALKDCSKEVREEQGIFPEKKKCIVNIQRLLLFIHKKPDVTN